LLTSLLERKNPTCDYPHNDDNPYNPITAQEKTLASIVLV